MPGILRAGGVGPGATRLESGLERWHVLAGYLDNPYTTLIYRARTAEATVTIPSTKTSTKTSGDQDVSYRR